MDLILFDAAVLIPFALDSLWRIHKDRQAKVWRFIWRPYPNHHSFECRLVDPRKDP